MSFSSLHTNSFFTSRLYIGMDQDPKDLKSAVFSGEKENVGLGMREYGSILGSFLTLIGIAFKTIDEGGKTLYINKRSFCALMERTYSSKKPDYIVDFNSVENRYHLSKKPEAQEYSTSRIKRIESLFDKIIKSKPNCDIGDFYLSTQQSMKFNNL